MVLTALTCLAMNVYFESRGESVEGQLAVAQVTLTRANNDPKKVCKSVYAPGQFGWTTQSKRVPTGDDWLDAKVVAKQALKGKRVAKFIKATHYHRLSEHPAWANKSRRLGRLGGHVFYEQPT